MDIRYQIIEEARRWKGTPYRHQGRLLGSGCDCAGLVIKVRESLFGVPDKWDKNYSRLPSNWNIKRLMDREFIQINFSEIDIGDILLLKIVSEPQHVGIVSPYSDRSFGMIHCYSSMGKVVEHRFNKVWADRVVQAYRMPEVL